MSKATVAGTATNRTIDDNYGDSVTGAKPTYSDGWNYGPECTGCLMKPALNETFDRSWHDVTASATDPAPRNVTLTFTGTAIWVYGFIPNRVPGATSFVNISFELDGKAAGSFMHVPLQTEDYQYNVTFYANTALENAQHTLVMTPQRQTNTSYMAFDWARYTSEPQTTSTSPTSMTTGALVPASVQAASQRRTAIVGGVIGGIALLILLVVAAFVYHRRRHRGADKIINIRRRATQRSDIEPAMQVDPFMDPGTKASVTAGAPDMSRMTLVKLPDPTSTTTSNFLHVANPWTKFSDDDPLTSPSTATRKLHKMHKKDPSSTSLGALPVDTNDAAPTVPAPTAKPPSPSHATRPAQTPRSKKTIMRREELSRQVRDMENAVADLLRRQSARTEHSSSSPPVPPLPGSLPESDDSDAALRRQIEVLQLEVERLRAQQDMMLREPPPAYQ